MSIRAAEGAIDDRIPVKYVLVSVSDKTGLDELIPGLMEASPEVVFMSTGGTYTKLQKILGDAAEEHLMRVADYTDFPEMDGGLVKTLHPKIFAGILGERNNPKHQDYLKFDLEDGVYIDMVIVNLYPFQTTVGKIESGEIDHNTGERYNFENARGNIDIGGPSMIRAAAKNFLGCAVVCDPVDYASVLADVCANDGCTTFNQRGKLIPKVFDMMARYNSATAGYTAQAMQDMDVVRACYTFNPATLATTIGK